MIELDVIDAAEAEGEKQRPVERQWRSWGDLTDHRAHRDLAQNEFMDGAAQPPSGASRRDFMKVMGASMALAGLTACRRPVEKILPYVRPPEEVTPGIPLYFATAMPLRGDLCGLLVESHEGRPTKVEGNPDHPLTQGSTGVFGQASVLTLYDPDRSREVLRDGSVARWEDFLHFCGSLDATTRLAVLAEPTASPTEQAQRVQLRDRFPQIRWIDYRPEGDDPVREGMQQAFGRPLRPFYHFEGAEVIVSLDADFLGPTAPNFVGNTRRFAQSRRLDDSSAAMSRLYCIESTFSLTGGQADHRLRMKASRIPAFAAALAAELGMGGGSDASEPLDDRGQRWVQEVARDLRRAGQNGVVLAGDTQPAEVHALCAALNSRLGAVGSTVTFLDTGAEPEEPSQAEALADLVADMRGGRVDALFMLGVNPVYDLPPAFGFSDAMARVNETVHLGLHLGETAQEARWHLPRAHYLEAWGDGRAYDGTLSALQPLIAPLYEASHSEIEVLNALATGLDHPGYDLVRETWRAQFADALATMEGDTFEERWRQVLHKGFVPGTEYPAAAQASAAAPDLKGLPASGDALELVFRLDPKVLAGEYANNAWMQELPDPITKITWDNVALMSRKTAEVLDVHVDYEEGKFYADVIELSVGEETIRLPAWVQPGYPDGSIGMTFGYGRHLETQRPEPEKPWFDFTDAYESPYEGGIPLANGVGANVAPLRSASLARVLTEGVEVQKTGETHLVATAQEHGSMEGHDLVKRATLEEFREHPDFADPHMPAGVEEESYTEYPMLWQEDHPSDQTAFKDEDLYVNQWGMVIDLNTCTGCNACIVACQSENNVQVVGKEEVARGREMQWLRLDRYYVSPAAASGGHGASGDGSAHAFDDPQMVVQPVMCQHCENAPCESVCPVAATVHSPDGMNQMIYNRCVGTRYCSNNCPYKVRRFNFFNWSKTIPKTVEMAQNPNVTVRFRGVMEKCSWCVQRIRSTQQRADMEERSIRDGEVQTACQQACPADAITFGDLNDPASEVSRLKEHARGYELLAQLNVKPRLSYLARVVNPNPQLEET